MATFCFVEPSVEAISGGLPNVAEIVESLVEAVSTARAKHCFRLPT